MMKSKVFLTIVLFLNLTFIYILLFKHTSSNLKVNIQKERSLQHARCISRKDGNCTEAYKKLVDINEDILRRIGFPMSHEKYITLDNATIDDFVLVTAASDNHFQESLKNIATAQKYFPSKKIIFYDIGLNKINLLKMRQICNVEVKSFDFSRYPAHVRKLKNFAWKMLIIYEELQTNTGIFWMDTSIRFNNSSVLMTQDVKENTHKNNGIFLFGHTGWSTFEVTHPQMYTYLTTDLELHKIFGQTQGGSILVYRTKRAIYDVMHWVILCALQKECIDPTGARIACPSHYRNTVYAGCHRHDQSAINIILQNLYGNQTHLYLLPYRISTVKNPKGDFSPKNCTNA